MIVMTNKQKNVFANQFYVPNIIIMIFHHILIPNCYEIEFIRPIQLELFLNQMNQIYIPSMTLISYIAI